MTDISFGDVSPVADKDYFSSGTLSVTCTFVILVGNIIVLPNISVCANLGPGSGSSDIGSRVLRNGSNVIPFNLYRSPVYTPANIWGRYDTASSINPFFAGLLAIGTNTLTFPVYAKISASDLAFAAVTSDSGTMYGTSFAGAGTMNYSSSSIVALPCQLSGTVMPFTFNVRANVINDCVIQATPVAFGPQGVLMGAVRAVGNLSVRCTAANSYRIALNGGTVTGLQNDRRMRNSVTGETVKYRLSSTLDGPVWGDGTNGTLTYNNSGTGAAQQVSVYGIIPGQITPTPGDYADKVTATIYF